MTLDTTAIIALSFAMIVFPVLIIIPSAFGFYKRVADFWLAAVHISSFVLAGLSLIIAVGYSIIALLKVSNGYNISLSVLLGILTIAILYFLFIFQQWLWELALDDVLSEAEKTREA